jgi:hypothetical protein
MYYELEHPYILKLSNILFSEIGWGIFLGFMIRLIVSAVVGRMFKIDVLKPIALRGFLPKWFVLIIPVIVGTTGYYSQSNLEITSLASSISLVFGFLMCDILARKTTIKNK